MAKGRKAVKIMFPGLTHSGKMYTAGDIEEDPTDFLLSAAAERTKLYHRDTNRHIRICRFHRSPVDDEEYSESEENDKSTVRTPAFDSGGYDDDLEEMKKTELVTIAQSLGMRKNFVREIEKNKIKSAIRFLRKL